jgi:hypothetical protein
MKKTVIWVTDVGLRGNKIALPLSTVVATKLHQPSLHGPVRCFEGPLLISPLPINWNNSMHLLHQEVKDLSCSDPLVIHSPASNKISHLDLHRCCPGNTCLPCNRIPPASTCLIDRSIVQVTTNNLAVGIMANVEKITDRVSDLGLLHQPTFDLP